MKPGVYYDITNSDYHSGPSISKSGLDLIRRSPAHLRWARDPDNDNQPTAAQALGTAFHSFLLEPDAFHAEYALMPKFDRRTTAGKAGAAEWEQANQGKTGLDQNEWDQLEAMRASVMAHTAARQLLTGARGKAESTVAWIDPITGVLCRARPDFWREDGIIVDLKTTEDASPEGFSRSIMSWRYHVQQAFYLDGCAQAIDQASLSLRKPERFVFLAVEKKPPHFVGVYALDADSVDIGRRDYQADLDLFAQCLAKDEWPAYGDRIMPISLPDWVLRREMFEARG